MQHCNTTDHCFYTICGVYHTYSISYLPGNNIDIATGSRSEVKIGLVLCTHGNRLNVAMTLLHGFHVHGRTDNSCLAFDLLVLLLIVILCSYFWRRNMVSGVVYEFL